MIPFLSFPPGCRPYRPEAKSHGLVFSASSDSAEPLGPERSRPKGSSKAASPQKASFPIWQVPSFKDLNYYNYRDKITNHFLSNLSTVNNYAEGFLGTEFGY